MFCIFFIGYLKPMPICLLFKILHNVSHSWLSKNSIFVFLQVDNMEGLLMRKFVIDLNLEQSEEDWIKITNNSLKSLSENRKKVASLLANRLIETRFKNT